MMISPDYNHQGLLLFQNDSYQFP